MDLVGETAVGRSLRRLERRAALACSRAAGSRAGRSAASRRSCRRGTRGRRSASTAHHSCRRSGRSARCRRRSRRSRARARQGPPGIVAVDGDGARARIVTRDLDARAAEDQIRAGGPARRRRGKSRCVRQSKPARVRVIPKATVGAIATTGSWSGAVDSDLRASGHRCPRQSARPASVRTLPSVETPTIRQEVARLHLVRCVTSWPTRPEMYRSELSPTMSSWPRPPKIVSWPPLPSM